MDAPDKPEAAPKPENAEMKEAVPDAFKIKRDIKNHLFSLGYAPEELKEDLDEVKEILGKAGSALNELKRRYSGDPDLFWLKKIYEDLKGDYDDIKKSAAEKLEIDTAYTEIAVEMRKKIDSAGVRRETPKETILSDQVDKLRSIGIEPEYIITQGNPNAHTIVMFKQLHSESGMSLGFLKANGVEHSQDQIKEAILRALDAGHIDTFFEEGSLIYDDNTVDLSRVRSNFLQKSCI